MIANPQFGTHCSAEGGGYSWYRNSREFQITPYSNDAVMDMPGEVFYVRDVATGGILSPTVLPLGRRAGQFKTRHGFGYTSHMAVESGIAMTLTQTVDIEDPVKRCCLRLVNAGGKNRTLIVTFYATVVLGHRRAESSHFVTTEHDASSKAFFVRNRWNGNIGHAVVFADLAGMQTSWTGNRLAVLGHCGGPGAPEGLIGDAPLSREAGGGYDPCIALQLEVVLTPGESREVVLTLGAAPSDEAARQLMRSIVRSPLAQR